MKGIMFKPDMVRAILQGTESVTRRVIKRQPLGFVVGDTLQAGIYYLDGDPSKMIKANYRLGEIVYVKEAWKDRLLTSAEVPEHVEIKVWNSPMFMPAWAARIFLEIVSVRSERLQTITEDDAIAEGIHAGASWITSPIEQYAALWDSINTRAGTRWADNPFVFRYEFRRTEASERDRERYL